MTEILSIKVFSLSEDGVALENCSCNLIFGSKVLNTKIPTAKSLNLDITSHSDEETATILIKHLGEIVAKSFISIGDLRASDNFVPRLLSLGAKADKKSSFTWDFSYSVIKGDLLHSETASASERVPLAHSIKSTSEHEDHKPQGNKVQLVTFDVIPGESQSINLISPKDVSSSSRRNDHSSDRQGRDAIPEESHSEQVHTGHLASSFGPRDLAENIHINVIKAEADTRPNRQYDIRNFIQSAPAYTPEDFARDENQSPDFNKNKSQPDTKFQFLSTYPAGKFEGIYNDIERISERRYSETSRSAIEEVKIEKNEDYVLTMKNQLTPKHLSFINDELTKDIILYMAQSKKKVSLVRLRRSITIRDKEEVDIEKKEYFNTNCDSKFVHFFQSSSKMLYLYNLVQPFDLGSETATKVHLAIDFDISPFHRSVITPSGLIFIAAAKPKFKPDSTVEIGSNTLHVFHPRDQTLVPRTQMNCQSRQQFGFCYMSKNLFVIGGIVDGEISNSCERYDMRTNKWSKIASMTKPLREASVCSFNNRYLYRVFGINSGNNIESTIERYDSVRDTWTMMNVKVSDAMKDIYSPFCTQVNGDSIFVFGGKNINGFSPKSCTGYVLKVEDKRGSNNAELVESKNFIPGLAGTFNLNSLLTHAGDVLFLRQGY